MLQITQRQKAILLNIINNNTPILIKDLAEKFNISVRTVRYDLEDIRYWLKQKNVKLEQKSKIGIWLDIDNNLKEEILSYLQGSNNCYVLLSKEKRINYILIEFFKTEKPITIEYLANCLKVSKSTIIKDLKSIKVYLEKYNIALISKPRIGHSLCGEEQNIRRLLSDILLKATNNYDILDLFSTTYNKHQNITLDTLNNLSVTIRIVDIKKAIKNSKKEYDFWMPDSSYASLIVHLAIAMDRLIKGQKIVLSKNKKELVKKNKEFLIAQKIAEELSKIYEIIIPEAEIVNITIHLISANMRLNFFNDDSIYNTDKSLITSIRRMIDFAGKKMKLESSSLTKLENDLYSHIQLTLKKRRLGVVDENPLLDQIKNKYSKHFQIAKEMISIFEKYENVTLDESEAGYIALYLGACSETSKHIEKKNVLVVCTTGKGSAKILSSRIKNTISDIQIKGLVSMFDIEDNDELLEDVDFIISTVSLKRLKRPVIKVSPLITNRELSKIKSFITQSNFENEENYEEIKDEKYIVSSLMNILDKYVDESDKKIKLKQELNNFFGFFMGMYNKNLIYNEALEEYSQKIAMIIADLGVMIQEIIDINSVNNFSNVLGIVIHIIMAIPRWERKSYNEELNINKYKQDNLDIFNIVKKHLEKIARKYNLIIPDSEIIAIMRYLI